MAPAKMTASADIVDTAVAAGSFDTLVTAVKAAGLVETLKGPGPFTVFAPSDAAFADVPKATLDGLLGDKDALTKVLTYHVVPGRITAAQAMKADWAETVNGQSLRIQTDSNGVLIDGARVVKADIETSNGIIHVIDRVVLPRKDIVDTAVAAGSFKTLVTAVKAADLVETLKGKGPFTVFAPADSAFAKLPAGTVEKLVQNKPALAGILTYHVVPGRVLSTDLKIGTIEAKTAQGQSLIVTKTRDGRVLVNGANVTSADILCGNGVIHVIDQVVLPKTP
jgi:uncharacterized surface protein with fasciclin (FAS1) repeats